MKRILALALALMMSISLVACGGGGTSTPAASPGGTDNPSTPLEPADTTADGAELALITDLGTIDDKSFNQGSWEGLEQYALENGISHKYYQPTEQSNDAYLSTIELAIKGGAKLVVTPGYLFEEPIFIAQETYPDVHFVLVDGQPHDADYNYRTDSNAVGILYAEEQAGFLAGYAAVMDGYTKLGFMGGMAVPAVVRFGYGYVQGAEHAAKELGMAEGAITMNYHYTGGFADTPEAQAMAASWYQSGLEVVFGCGGAVGNSVMRAAEDAGGKVIGVDIDQSGESETVITSAMKGLRASVYSAVSSYYAGNFPGGTTQIFDASTDGVGLPMGTSKFETFSDEQYNTIYAQLAGGEVVPEKDVFTAVTDIPTSCVAVTLI